jgi:SAM-dependent methyltransferase
MNRGDGRFASSSVAEVDRVRSVFGERDRRDGTHSRWQLFNPACLHFVQERERLLLALLLRHGFGAERVESAAVLSLGCGSGSELLDLVRYGALPGHLFGVDLVSERLQRAKVRNPALSLTEANATAVPFRGASFDLVLQFTLLTSVLEPESRQRIAAEMLRLLRPGGMIIWYDFWPDNPRNPDVRGIRPAEIRSLFPGCTFDFQALTLPPPLARWLVPRSWLLADVLSRFPPLKSFYLVGIRRDHA